MKSCSQCSLLPELREEGWAVFYERNPSILQEIHKLLIVKADQVIMEDKLLKVFYTSKDHLVQIMESIHRQIPTGVSESLLVSYTSSKIDLHTFPTMISMEKMYKRITNSTLMNIINQRIFTSFMQPIIDLQSSHVYGYEFLLRPQSEKYPFYPAQLFTFSQQAGLQSLLDSQARIASIEAGASVLKKGTKRFINFMPSSIYDPNHCLKSTFKAVNKFGVDPNDLVFEVVETEKIEDIQHLKMIFQTYQQAGMKVALDDLGTGYSTLSVLKELKPNFAKIDRSLVSHCDTDRSKQEAIKAIVETGGEFGMTLLVEGIERNEEAQFCKEAGVQLGQGYLFGRPAPTPIKDDKIAI